MKRNKTFNITLLICLFHLFGWSNSIAFDLSLGLIYPGVSIKAGLTKNIALDYRISAESNILNNGLRGYWYFNPDSRWKLFLGGEYDYFTFNYDTVKGAGSYIYGFTGLELFITKNISIMGDIGYGYANASDDTTKTTYQDYYPVANLGINLYLYKPQENKETGNKEQVVQERVIAKLPKLEVRDVKYDDKNGNNVIDALENSRLTFVVENNTLE
ncbi:MAG: hypothetical protein WC955_08590 [Elusimicrobiota bacterium]